MRAAVLRLLEKGTPFGVGEIVARTGVSRQAAHRHLASLVQAGSVRVEGRGRATRYRPAVAGRGAGSVAAAAPAYERSHDTAGLAEDRVWAEVRAALPALHTPSARNAEAVSAYAFTEMVNNAIDHSGSKQVTVRAGQAGDLVWFEVEDAGVGAFENVRRTFALPDVLAGLQEISKGKRTTQADRHSGEGIFFTSKMADRFELASNGVAWLVDNLRQDHAVEQAPARPGTAVRFEVSLAKDEGPEEVFARYTHDFEFDTTRTVVKLFAHGVRFVSRSEAKRLLLGLERFRQVILDFAGVEAVGQGFADEVFRVWKSAHPEVALEPVNMVPPVAFMITRAARHPA